MSAPGGKMAGSPQALRAAARGDRLADQGRLLDALRSYEQALRFSPQLVEARINAGLTLSAMGKHGDALAALQRAVAERPDHAAAQFALGDVQRRTGALDAAEASYRAAIALNAQMPGPHSNLGAVLRQRGRVEEAIALLERAVALAPGEAGAWLNLGLALQDRGRILDAERHFRRALELDPRLANAHLNLGSVLLRLNYHEEAADSFRRALAVRRDDPVALAHLGLALQPLGRLAEVRDKLRHALVKAPDSLPVRMILAHDRMLHSDAAGAVALLDGAAAHDPTPAGRADADGTRVLYQLYDATITPQALFAAHRAWAATHAIPLRATWAPHDNDRDPNRRLRVGFISSDLRGHAVAQFLLPLLGALDPAQVEPVLYANVARPDAMSRRLQAHARWEPIAGERDDMVAAKIRAQQIDILIDLGGHTISSLLLVLARKPAPVQASWLGYASTTGLDAIDWRFSDAASDPPEDDALSSERVMRLPGFHCYGPSADAPAVAAPPSAASGVVTFGSFNNIIKLSDACVALYARVLAAVPGARLLLKSSSALDDEHIRHHFARFAAHGVPAERVTMLPFIPGAADHFARYGEIDVALDAVPYCGTTTTCEALWMGVPVVTLVGDRHAARVGASLLGQVGLDDFIARTPDEFVAIAAGWAARPADLARLRDSLRSRLAASPLCDATGFARRFETALRAMWRDWASRS